MSDLVETDYNTDPNGGTFTVLGSHSTHITRATASGPSQVLSFVPFTDPQPGGVNIYQQAECVYDITLSANCTLTFALGTAVGIFQRLTLILRQPATGSGFTVTLPTGVNYPGGTPPSVSTAAASATIITFTTADNGATVFATESATFPNVVSSGVPGQVTGLTLGTPTTTTLPLSWTAPSTGGAPTGYGITYTPAGGSPVTLVSPNTATNFTLGSLVPGTIYSAISVTAENNAGPSTPSASVSGKTASPAPTTTSAVPTLAQPVAFANLHTDPAALTLASTATAGNHAIVLTGSYDRDAVLPSGWTQVAQGTEQSSAHVSAWQAPVSTLTSNGVSIGGNQYGGGYLIETTATAFDGAVIDGGSNNSPTFTFNPVAATKANAQRFALVFGYVGSNVAPTVAGATIVDYLMGADGGGSAFTILLSVPDGSTASITVTMANINASDVGVAFVNAYAA